MNYSNIDQAEDMLVKKNYSGFIAPLYFKVLPRVVCL